MRNQSYSSQYHQIDCKIAGTTNLQKPIKYCDNRSIQTDCRTLSTAHNSFTMKSARSSIIVNTSLSFPKARASPLTLILLFRPALSAQYPAAIFCALNSMRKFGQCRPRLRALAAAGDCSTMRWSSECTWCDMRDNRIPDSDNTFGVPRDV